MYPHKACVGTLLAKLFPSARSYPDMDKSSTPSGTRTGLVRLGEFDGTPNSGISKRVSFWDPQIHDSSAPPITPFTFEAVLEKLSAIGVDWIPMSLLGAPGDGQGSEHQTNLKNPKHVNVDQALPPTLPPVLPVGDICHSGNVPTSTDRAAPNAITPTEKPAGTAAPYLDSSLGLQTVSVPPTEGQDPFAGSSLRPLVYDS